MSSFEALHANLAYVAVNPALLRESVILLLKGIARRYSKREMDYLRLTWQWLGFLKNKALMRNLLLLALFTLLLHSALVLYGACEN